MNAQLIIDDLFRELLFTAVILMAILLHNNLVLYRRKFSDTLSLMLVACACMCVFELQWDYSDGLRIPGLLGYFGPCGYAMAFLSFGITLNRFFLGRFGLLPKKKWQNVLFYLLPGVLFALLCVTTPWTRLLFWIDENSVIQEMLLFHTLFYGLLLAYLLSALAPACYYVLTRRRRDPSQVQLAKSLIVFGVLGPIVYLIQMLIHRNPDSDYLALSLAVALALVYLTANVNTRSLLESQAKVEAVESDLRIAAKIQANALPPAAPAFEGHPELELRASMHPAREVGGDFYDYFLIDSHRLCLLIADVSGKGTPAALFMMTVKTTIKDHALLCADTAEIFTAVNQRLCENNAAGMFATAWIGIYDMRTHILQYTNAGHNYPLFCRRGEACAVLKKVHGLFLAGMEDTQYRRSEMEMRAGDRLLLYTDGITEAHDRGGALYGTDRLIEVLNSAAQESGERALEQVTADVKRFAQGMPQFDDMTMLILTIREQEAETNGIENPEERI